MKADFEFIIEFSTSDFTCVGSDCGRFVGRGAKILVVNGRQRDFCVDCARAYLKQFIKSLNRIEGCVYAICDKTALAETRARLTYPPDEIREKDIDSLFDPTS
jgi:hypothetical protein